MRIVKLTIVALGLLASWAASAVTFTVNSVADVPAADNLPNGVCETAPGNGVCTLRAALQKANALPGVGAVIVVPAGTYVRGSPYPDVVAPLTLQGAGLASTTLDAAGLDGGLTIQLGIVATINGITIRNAAPTKTGVGAGLNNLGMTTIADSQIVDGKNSGIVNAGTLVVRNSSILRNAAGSAGGGVFSQQGAMTVTNSLVANNAAGAGGGIYVVQGHVALVNSTISNNVATSHGGGVGMAPLASVSTIEVFNSTIAGNLVTAGSPTAGGGVENLGGTVRLQNTLLANNFIGTNASDCVGAIVSLDYNWLQTTAGCTLSGATTHNQVGGDPMLDVLRLNGGPTLTRALLAGSPAIGAIPSARCTDQLGAPLATDQRGSPRSAAVCDIGAFEGALPTPMFDVNLIRNGDAEQSAGAPTGATVGIPNWTVRTGAMTVVSYGAPGGFPVVGKDVVQGAHGSNFFAGGPTTDNAQAAQIIDLAPASAAIDTGMVAF
ncbi:MAG TPA: choice-of-anchor Q domain-containing protein, partial [Casimicrobiaceae bacterium]|nr:choice-of-anchor Q domain-containing protein [Casimicrobiaceae bacterium]